MKTLIKLGTMAMIVMFFAASCKKEAGTGGKKIIKGTITYAGGAAAGAIVTIAYDVTDATTQVNDQVTAGADGTYTITNLQKGDYFIDATYTDSYGFAYNSPGTLVTIGKKKGDVTVDLTVN